MDKNGIFILILLFMVVVDSSDASFARNFRKLIGPAPNDSSTATQNLPMSSPNHSEKKSNPSGVDVGKPGKEKPKDTQMTSNSSNLDSKGLNDNNNIGSASPSTDKQIAKGKSPVVKEKGENKTHSQSDAIGSCKRSQSCRDQNETLFACVQNSENGSKELVLLVQNKGEKTLKVNLSIPTTVDNGLQAFEIPSHQTKEVNIPLTLGKITKIVLNAGNGDCELHMDAIKSERNFLKQLSFYSKQVTPINGAYFLFLLALVFGGTWACCNFRKRRSEGEVPYQELEMAMPESSAAVNVATAEDWDQDWDDDWDQDKAEMSQGGRHARSISANGLTSRSSKRDD